MRVEAVAGVPARKALAVFESALTRRGTAVRRGTPDGSGLVIDLRIAAGKPESFEIAKSATAVTVTGGNSQGLAYGIFELLGQIERAAPEAGLLSAASPVSRSPEVPKRGMTVFLYNRELESQWLYDPDYWERYFELMARSRLNYFTLVFGHQTSYLAPLFPFMIDVPGYERVRAPSFTDQDRRRNLEMLRRISQMAEEWGIRFVLGIWQQHAHLYGRNLVEGLSYQDLFDYCPKALALILKACPNIRGVQFRMNIESGIEEDDQNRFYTGMAKAIRSVGRPIEVDFRAKGLRPETVKSSLALGIRPIVSTKYWREHMGLPFHGTRIDAPDKARSYRRYGYWDLLSQNRPYDVAYRMWTLGSVKILLWGGLDYARQFARSSRFGGSIGFEVCAPLSQKGFGNWAGGNWRIFSRPDLEYYRWEFERYWAYYLSFGLAGYDPGGPQPVLDAEFRKRFEAAAPAVRSAYDAASWIIPFITATRAVSNSNFGYWPETETGGLTDRYVALGTGDDNRFYHVDEYVAGTLERRVSAKLTPDSMAERLETWALAIETSMRRASDLLPAPKQGPEYRSTQTDFGVLAALARYHGARLRSAVDYEFFSSSGERQRLRQAIAAYEQAVAHWREIVRLTEGVYYPHMVFNRPPDQIGHWKDELPFLEHDWKRLKEIDSLYDEAAGKPGDTIKWQAELPRYRLTMKWKEENGALSRWMDPQPAPETSTAAIERYSLRQPREVLGAVFQRVRYQKILHAPLRFGQEGKAIPVHASLTGLRAGDRLRLFYRLGASGFRFQEIEMKESGPNLYSAAIRTAGAPQSVFYYLRADGPTASFHGSEKEPHQVSLRAANAQAPAIVPRAVGAARVGHDVPVTAEVRSPRKPVAVRLRYRHLDQSEEWRVIEMVREGSSAAYSAVIPGEFVVPGWDLMYEIEAVDESGAGTFFPDEKIQDPAIVISVNQ